MHISDIKAIIGLGNPGSQYKKTRHNIGFMIVDALAQRYNGSWQHKDKYDSAEIMLDNQSLLLIKPQTFMNHAGDIMAVLIKKGIKSEQILVVHDELEKSLGSLHIRLGGSARGHNGLRSIMNVIGADFYRLRFGIGRPANKEDVGDWVLSNFEIPETQLNSFIDQAITMLIAA